MLEELMNPSHVRVRILEDHEAIRQQLSELEAATDALLGDKASMMHVGELTQSLLVVLARHTELEDEILAPALKDIDAWGAVRADQLLAHHQTQRADIREVSKLFDLQLVACDVARVVHALVQDLRADMEHEERDLLNADLLRDDLVAVGGNSG
jgi:hypothetical protein